MAHNDTPPPEFDDSALAQANGDQSPPWAEHRLHGQGARPEFMFDKIQIADPKYHGRPLTPPSSTSPLLDNDHLELLTALQAALQDSTAPSSNSHEISTPGSHADLQHDALKSLIAEIDNNVLTGANIYAVASTLQVPDDEKSTVVQSFNAARHAAGLEVIPQQHFGSLTAIAGGNGPAGETTPACAIFGGQGLRGDRVQELRELAQTYSSLINDLLEDSAELLAGLSKTDAVTRQHCHKGLDVLLWLRHPEQTPDAAYIRSAPVSAPLIGLVQLLQYAATCRTLGLTPGEFSAGLLSATTGHSQGIITAAAVASATDWPSYRQAMRTALMTLFWIGVRTQQVWDSSSSSSSSSSRGEGGSRQPVSAAMLQDSLDHDERAPSPMLSVRGLSRTTLQGCLRAANRYLGVSPPGTAAQNYHSNNAVQQQEQQRDSSCSGWLEICMVNGPQQFVVSGPPRHLYGLNLQIRKAKQLLLLQGHSGDDDDRDGPYEDGGRQGGDDTTAVTTAAATAAAAALPSSKFLDVSVPFHSTHVGAAVALVLRDVAHLSIYRAALAVPVLGTEQGEEEGLVDPGVDNILPLLVGLAVSSKVDWVRTMQAATTAAAAVGGAARVMLDFGPGGVNGIGSLVQDTKKEEGSGQGTTTTSVVVGAWSGGRPGLRHRGDLYAWAQGNPWK